MTAYLAEHLDLSEYAANELRQFYWRRYGATLVGLIRHHGIDPHHFLRETHRFPQIGDLVVGRRELRSVLRRLPGHKIVFSNAPAHYSRAILAALGVDDLFDDVFSIERTRFRPKPDAHGSADCCARTGCWRRAASWSRTASRTCAPPNAWNEDVWVDRSSRSPPGWTRMSVTSCACRGCCACSRPALTTEDAEDAEKNKTRKSKVG